MLKNDVPFVSYDSKAILQRCKQENNKIRIHKKRMAYMFSSIIILFILIFGIVFMNYRLNKEVIDINNDIKNLGKIDDNETRMLEIMRIETEVNNLSDTKRNKIDLSKLSFETNNTVINLKKEVSWNEYFDESSNYYKLNFLINFENIKKISLLEGMYSSQRIMSNDNNFINSILLFFDDTPYAALTYDEQEEFFEIFNQELNLNIKYLRNYDEIELYNTQLDNDDNLIDLVCTIKVSPGAYVILNVPVFDEATGEILEYKQYISLIPLDYNKYLNITNRNESKYYVDYSFDKDNISYISIYLNSNNTVLIDDEKKIIEFLSNFDNLRFLEISKIKYSTSSKSVEYNDAYVAFLIEKEETIKISIKYIDKECKLYVKRNDYILYMDEDSYLYKSIDNYDVIKMLEELN